MAPQETLNKAARLVEDEAILFEEEAAEILKELGSEADKEDLGAVDAIRGRARSLRDLARRIRLIES